MRLLWCDKKQSCIDHSMFCVLDVGSTIASPTVIESNSGLGRCLACRTRSSVLLLFNQRLFQSIHWFSSGKHTSTPVCADTTSSILVLFMLRYIWNPTPWQCRIAPRGEVWTKYRVGKKYGNLVYSGNSRSSLSTSGPPSNASRFDGIPNQNRERLVNAAAY